jgi:glycosyltransferase involved in cell wall biosynthesis
MARALFYVSQQVPDFHILLSIAQEPNRQFDVAWEGLDVHVQKSLMLRRLYKHASGFQDEVYVHFPYDTLSQLRRARPDIVFSFELGFRSLLSAFYCTLYRKPLALGVCVSEHTEQGRGPVRRMLRRALLKSASAVTYNGPSCRRYLKTFGVPDNRLFHFPYAASDLFQYSGPIERTAAASHRLMYVGQFNERKGLLPMIRTLADYCSVRDQRVVELDLVGSGNQESQIGQLRLPPNLRLTFLGHLNYDQMSAAMQNVGALIFPTLADEWGLVVNEAFQAGLPVLGSVYAQACTTLIQPDKNGWLYHPEKSHELHRSLDQFFGLAEKELIQMRSCARDTVRDITSASVAAKAVRMIRQLNESCW